MDVMEGLARMNFVEYSDMFFVENSVTAPPDNCACEL